jgi:hypothetical protein
MKKDKKKQFPKRLKAIYANSSQEFVAKTKAQYTQILNDAEAMRRLGYQVTITEI